ncbi:Hypothetical predicted protein [Pelobates cultripes]|uniref:Uncharacterized protein n=1 Tax=Pelobates cultripes TaxID=61616 RepID=A0AAD1VMT5_PELCU|nr:Hypothetical predicted protein [Pelobates cultripes]
MSRILGRFANLLRIHFQTVIADEICRSLAGIFGFCSEQTKIVSLPLPVSPIPRLRHRLEGLRSTVTLSEDSLDTEGNQTGLYIEARRLQIRMYSYDIGLH